MNTLLTQLMNDAKAAGILPPDAVGLAHETRPWPVVLLTALGAWLAAVPLFGVVALLLDDVLRNSTGLFFIGGLLLAGSLVVLRSRSVPLFVEQLAVPGLIVGGMCIGMAIYQNASDQMAAMLVGLLALAVASVLPQSWLRALLGFAAAGFVTAAFVDSNSYRHSAALASWLFGTFAVLGLWTGAYAMLETGKAGSHSAAIEPIAAGWSLSVILGCASWSGLNLLDEKSSTLMPLMQGASLLLALAAAGWVARCWPAARQPWVLGVAAVLAALAWMMPSLGAVLLVMALCVTSGRWLLAAASAVAAVWIMGAFYYQLSFPLATKAAMLVLAGLLLGAMAWLGAPRGASVSSHATLARPPLWNKAGIGMALALFAVLAVANTGIWRNENLIATGRPVFVDLAPRDPRSLMQGDFMRLNFRLPEVNVALVSAQRPHVVAKTDPRGVATLTGLHDGRALAEGEFLIELTPKDGQWTLVTDAWFFKEGDAKRWEAARYGEFRVLPDGRALLVDLRGPALEKL